MWDIVEKDHREHHGKALHPQTQGLVERGNGQLKKRILKAGMDQGHKHSNSTFDWGDVLDKELVKENDKAVYGGLSAFFCLRNRARDCTNLRVVPPEMMGKLHKYMHDCQVAQGNKMILKGNPVKYAVGDIVRVHSTGTRIKLGHVFHPWGCKAKIMESHPRTPFYYGIRWTTVGTKGEKAGTTAK